MSDDLDLFSDAAPTPEPAEFLAAVWGNGPHSLCWNDPEHGFRYVFADTPTEMLDLVAKLPGTDVWFGAHPLRGIPARGRGDEDDIAEVVAIPADLDWAHETRRTEKVLPTECEVRDALAHLGPNLQPSIVVNSGHGLQAWWVLTEPVTPDDAKQLIAQLDVALANVGLENGRSDLASILRLPGTNNCKGGVMVVPVVIETWDTHREFPPEYLREHWPTADVVARAGGTKHRRGSVTHEQQELCNYVVTQCGGHSVDVWSDGTMHVVRPGKLAKDGSSASIIVGDEGDALLTVFSDNWPDLSPGSYMLGPDGALHHPSDVRAKIIIETTSTTPPSIGGYQPEQHDDVRPLLTWERAPDPFVIPPIEWLIQGMWCDGTHGELAGGDKTLKSVLAMLIDVGLAAGVPVLGRFDVPTPRRVLHLAGEGGRAGYWRRFERVCAAYGVSVDDVRPMLEVTFNTASVSSPRFVAEVQAKLEVHRPALTHVDPWYAYSPRGVDSRQLIEVGAALETLGGLCRQCDSTLLINNHFNQTGTGDGLKRITGAGHAEWVDSWMLVAHREQPDVPGGRFRLSLQIGSRQWGGTSCDVDLDIGRFDVIAGTHDGPMQWDVQPATTVGPDPQAAHDVKIADAKRALRIKAKRRTKPWKRDQLIGATPGTAAVLRVAFDQMVDDGELVEVGTATVPSGRGTRQVPLYQLVVP